MVIYYTGTGNSRLVAAAIAKETEDELVTANKNIKSGRYEVLTSDKAWVFVCPTYAWNIPYIFRQYIVNTKFEGSRKAYFVMTCGTDIGAAEMYVKQLCQEKEFDFMGLTGICMPENYIAMFNSPSALETIQIVKDGLAKAAETAVKIKNSERLKPVKYNVFDKAKSGIINKVFYDRFQSATKFTVSDKCDGCGACEKLCPVNCIKLEDNKPKWEEKCCHCMACISACHNKAIEYGNASKGKLRIYNGEAR